jgi:hypothetical protein
MQKLYVSTYAKKLIISLDFGFFFSYNFELFALPFVETINKLIRSAWTGGKEEKEN